MWLCYHTRSMSADSVCLRHRQRADASRPGISLSAYIVLSSQWTQLNRQQYESSPGTRRPYSVIRRKYRPSSAFCLAIPLVLLPVHLKMTNNASDTLLNDKEVIESVNGPIKLYGWRVNRLL